MRTFRDLPGSPAHSPASEPPPQRPRPRGRRRGARTSVGLALLALAAPGASAESGEAPAAKAGPVAPPSGPDSVQDVIFLGEDRPIVLRLHIAVGDRPFRSAWTDSVLALHKFLDRDGDGKVTKDEAKADALSTLVRVANGTATAMPRTDLDNHPKDGVVSVEELSDALRSALGPFRVQVGKAAGGKTDALFEQLDGDKDGNLDRPELSSAAGSLQRLDLDDDELIDAAELEPFRNPTAMQSEEVAGRRARLAPVPTVLELTPDDTTLRPVRLLMKKYDRGSKSGATAGDNKLSRDEFAVGPKAFAAADADADGALDAEELRRLLGKVAPDLELGVNLPARPGGDPTIAVAGSGGVPGALPPGVKVKRLGGGDVEIAVDEIRLEVHGDAGDGASADAKRAFTAQFRAADKNNDGYLEKKELTEDRNHPSPLAGLFDLMDRDGDGKLYAKEMDLFIDAQAEAARGRMVLSTSDQGRAIFAILDLNRDRRLGLRELRGTLDRVASWDRDGDLKITADEIPHHYQLTLSRGSLSGLGAAPPDAPIAGPMTAPPPTPAASGPAWFRRMDRNGDGDVSRREFLGSRAQFDRLDLDKDALLDAAEAAAVTVAKKDKPGPVAGPSGK